MAVLESSGTKDSVHEGLCFLDVVRSAYLANEPPRLPIDAQCCYARLYLMKSDKPQRPSSGFGKLVLVKKAWSPFNLALGGEGTARDSCYLFDSSGEMHFSACRYWFYCCMQLCGIMGCF